MNTHPQPIWIAFAGTRRLAQGPAHEVAAKAKNFFDDGRHETLLVFDALSSHAVEIDLRGSVSAVLKRLKFEPEIEAVEVADSAPRTAGRPRLGVVPREVTLLPRHWQWLSSQPGGASVALRKLVEQAARASRQADQIREARESAYRFMQAIAGDHAGYEEATRALFAGDHARFSQAVQSWPKDVRHHALALADAARPEHQDI